MKRAFTLVELLIVLAMVSVLVCVLMPMAAKSRAMDMTTASQANLRLLGSASNSFASNNGGEIFSLGTSNNVSQYQAIEILSRLTGREVDSWEPSRLIRLSSITPNRRYQHLVLMEYLGASATSPIAASPFDRNLLQWQQDPVLAQQTTVPYASGRVPAGYDKSSNWFSDDVRQMWPYASTYQTVPAAWNPNNNMGAENSWAPVSSTPHLFTTGDGQQRYYPEVVFPSGKVHMFEEFDRLRWRDHLWFAYPHAKCNLLFFDGSVRRLLSSDSNAGWNPNQSNSIWKQRYMPLDKFPTYSLQYKNNHVFFMKYRWTREGLAGIDYGGQEPNRPPQAHPKFNPDPDPLFHGRTNKIAAPFPMDDG